MPRALKIFLATFFAALCVRFLHDSAMLLDPLYFHPLGGHTVYFTMAEDVARGQTPTGIVHSSSPLYVYFLSLFAPFEGTANLHWVRLAQILLDSFTCAFTALLSLALFGETAAMVAGALAALSAPLIFFADQLTEVPLELFFLVAGYTLFVWRRGGFWPGVLLGIATAFRPNLLLATAGAAAIQWILQRPRATIATFACGLFVGIAPILYVNARAAGHFVGLSTSGGNNFYLGHRPGAGAGYTLPRNLDGDIFLSMKKVAEDARGTALSDEEVSSFYYHQGFAAIARAPLAEAKRIALKTWSAFNDYEAETYSNIYYEEERSPILHWALGFGWAVVLAAAGVAAAFRNRRARVLWIPIFGTVAIIVGFFFVSRVRAAMIPFVIVWASACVLVTKKDRLLALAAAAVAALIAFLPTGRKDPSNEWNKVAVVLRAEQRDDEAKAALEKAISENPNNPNSYMNLAALYEAHGENEKAAANRARGEALLAADKSDAENFTKALAH